MNGIKEVDYFYLFACTFIIVGFLTPLMRKIALSNNIVDSPDRSHKTHKTPVPYLGGIAIITGVLLVSYGGLIFRNRTGGEFWVATSLLLPATILGLIGLIDDKKNLSPLPRLIAQTIAGVFTAFFLINTDTVGNPTGNIFVDAGITVLWVVGITNAINFFDNLDGGASGTVAITCLGVFLIAHENGQFFLAGLSITTFGAMIGFLVWNKSPARIYMGDAGALFLGIVVSVLTLRLDPNVTGKTESLSIPLLLLAIPILDTSVAVISRLSRGISPLKGGRDHLSHRLLRIGISKKITAILLWLLSALFMVSAFTIANFDINSGLVIGASGALWLVFLLGFLNMKFDG